MTTEYLTAVIADGDFKIAQRGESEGAPGTAGRMVIDFIEGMATDVFAEQCRKVQLCDERAVEGFREQLARKALERTNPAFSPQTGARILEMVETATNDTVFLPDERVFGGNGRLCRHAYVVNLDTRRLEFYAGGFGHDYEYCELFAPFADSPEYELRGPVRLVASYHFDDLPTADDMRHDLNAFRNAGKEAE